MNDQEAREAQVWMQRRYSDLVKLEMELKWVTAPPGSTRASEHSLAALKQAVRTASLTALQYLWYTYESPIHRIEEEANAGAGRGDAEEKAD